MFTNHLFVLAKIHQRSENSGRKKYKIQKALRDIHVLEYEEAQTGEFFIFRRGKKKTEKALKTWRYFNVLLLSFFHLTVIFFNGWNVENKMLKTKIKTKQQFFHKHAFCLLMLLCLLRNVCFFSAGLEKSYKRITRHNMWKNANEKRKMKAYTKSPLSFSRETFWLFSPVTCLLKSFLMCKYFFKDSWRVCNVMCTCFFAWIFTFCLVIVFESFAPQMSNKNQRDERKISTKKQRKINSQWKIYSWFFNVTTSLSAM